jgi:hypothetical protein
LEPYQPEPTEETLDEPKEGKSENEKIEVNPADVPLEIVEPSEENEEKKGGDGVQMDLFGGDL